MTRLFVTSRLTAVLLALAVAFSGAPAVAQTKKPAAKPNGSTTAAKTPVKKTVKRASWRIPTYADSTEDDIAEFDDQVVREAAVAALGRYNGSVVAVDPNTGRILTIVNQRMAFSEGFQPCSTIKPFIGMAALEEGIITRDTMIPIGRRRYMNLTEAMAHSNNPYFEYLGRQMGFQTVSRYAKLMGLGENAGLNIFEEHPGEFPKEPPEWGGVGRMSSFGEGIHMTPLQLAALGVMVANGGTLYWLQYPRSAEERQNFAPQVKRKLNYETLLPELREGMLASVLYGTGRASFDPYGEQLLGKTGTCSDQGSRLGWFVSFNDSLNPQVVVAVLMRGQSRQVGGGTAAEIAGRVFRGLHERNYFAENRESRSKEEVAVAVPKR